MPIVHVEFFEGRPIEKKRELVQGITETVARTCQVDADGVHVLLEERTRENWGRGALLNSDRPPRQDSEVIPGVDSGDVVMVLQTGSTAEKVPALPSNGLLGIRQGVNCDSDATPAALVLGACSPGQDAQDAWDGFLAETSVADGKVMRCLRADLPLGGLRGQNRLPLHLTIGTHHVREDTVDEYLQLMRLAVHPEMNRCSGFVSSDRLRQLPSGSSFFVVNHWLSREHAEAYASSPAHDMLKARVRPLLHDRDPLGSFDVLPDRAR
ncbi:MAG: hypothetical protein GEV10_15820 [Streptosporangiales bacterium]|nr:hypothetical protein [Streptosporangiales bacterium]